MSTPINESEPTPEAPLVEPARNEATSELLEALDTARILQETAAIPVPADATPVHDEPEATPTTAEHPAGGWNVLSIVSLVLALAFSPLAVIFGYLAVGQIRHSAQRGEALAWFAVGLGWLWAVAYVVAGAVLALTWLQVA